MSSSTASEFDPEAPPAIGLADLEAAQKRLAGHAVLTPLVESPALNKLVGGRVLVKAEMLQRTGSFKFRGAYNAISQFPASARKGGVVTYSSGNHAQGVAAAAQELGFPAAIVMPADAPAIKVANTKSYGAEVVLYDRYREDREVVGAKLAAERGAEIVPPYDDLRIVAGQGTVGLEIAAQAKALGARLDAVLAPCGGGGLIAGTALGLVFKVPGVPVYAVEPAEFDDTGRSLRSGRRERVKPGARTICDALMAPTPGRLTFALNKQQLAGAFAVTDDEVAQAMAAAFTFLKLVVEPGGAVALAAVLSRKFDARGKTVCVVCSGGNVDPALFAKVLGRGLGENPQDV